MENNKINIDRPEISSEEIAQGRDFQAVLKGAKPVSKPFYKTKWFIANSIAAAIIIGGAVLYTAANNNDKALIPAKNQAFINVPLQGTDVLFESFQISTETVQQITHTSGTKLTVPEHAFVDKDGKPVEGKVEIRYREIHDKPEIFLSGIPMDYDSAGTKYVLESAGMLEIKGFKDGEEIFIAEGKEIAVELHSRKEGTDYNLYELDTVEKNWKYRGKDAVSSVPQNSENDSIDEAEPIVNPEIARAEKELASVQNEIATIEKQKPVKPGKARDDKWTFDIEVSEYEFPEVAVYKNTLWEVDESVQKFDPSYQNIMWLDVVIKKTADQNSYLIHFSSIDKEVEYTAKPVYEGADYANAKSIYDAKFKEYTKKLVERKEAEQKLADELKAKREKWLAEQAEMRLQNLEQSLTWKPAEYRNNAESIVFRSFTINNFGIWNCDRPVMKKQSRTVRAIFTDRDGKELLLNTVYVVDETINSMFKFYRNYNTDNNIYKLSFNPSSTNMIWAVTSANKLAVLRSNEFNAALTNGGDKIPVQLSVIDSKINSVSDFTSLYDNNFEVGENEEANDDDSKISLVTAPNPCKDVVNVKTQKEAKYKVQLYAISGMIVKNDEFSGTEHEIAIADLPQGTYILKTTWNLNDDIVTSRLMKN